jgi:hypothetical protein
MPIAAGDLLVALAGEEAAQDFVAARGRRLVRRRERGVGGGGEGFSGGDVVEVVGAHRGGGDASEFDAMMSPFLRAIALR